MRTDMTREWMTRAVTAGVLAGGLAFAGSAFAADQPGQGVEVQPIKSSIAEETFQTLLVMKALEELGYDVKEIKEIEYAAGHVALGNGDATFMADHWDPLHSDFYTEAGGDEKLYREGVYAPGALQGYLIDKKTAGFDPSKFHDRYVDALKDLIERKKKSKSNRKIIEDKDDDGP